MLPIMSAEMSASEAIRTLRVLRGFSLTDLAERAAISTEQLRALEAGHREADLETVVRLSLLFGVDPRALQEGTIQRPESSPQAGRVFLFSGDTDSFRTADLRVFSRGLQHGRFYVTQTEQGAHGLQRRLRLSPVQPAGPDNADAARQGHRLAQMLRLLLQQHGAPIFDLRQLVEEQLGIVVSVAHMVTRGLRAGAVLDLQRAGAAMLLRARPQRAALRRVEMAHELCHLLFDPLGGEDHVQLTVDTAAEDRPSASLLEARARGFAAELLLPRAGLLELLGPPRRHHTDGAEQVITHAQEHFGTPRQLTVNHLANTGYFDETTRYRLLRGPTVRLSSRFSADLPAPGALPLCLTAQSDPLPDSAPLANTAWQQAARLASAKAEQDRGVVGQIISEALQVDRDQQGARTALVLSRWLFSRAEQGAVDQIEALYNALDPSAFSPLTMIGLLGATFSLQEIAAEARAGLVARTRDVLRAGHGWSEERIHRATGRF